MGAAAESPARAGPRTRLATALICFLAAGCLVGPLWLVSYPPLLDYPNHLARTFILAHLQDPAFRFPQFYRADWGWYPYLTMDLALLGLQHWFPAELAGRIFLTLCLISFPLGAWFFLREANPGHDSTAVWALVAAYNVFFLEGFLNFYLSLGLCFVALGLWLRFLARQCPARWLLSLVAFTALYFTHLLGFGIAALVAAVYGLLAHRRIRDLALSGLLFLPGAIFYGQSSLAGAGQSQGFEFRGLADKVDALSAIMHGYSSTLDVVTLVALAGYFLAGWWRNPRFRWNSRWLAVAAVLFAVYWALPWAYGDGSDLDIRVLPVLFVLILATARMGRRGRQLAAVVLVLFALRLADVARNFVAAQPELAALARSFQDTPPNVRVLPIVESDEDPIRRPFTHFWAYGVIRNGWLSPYISDLKGVTPLRVDYDYAPDGFWDLAYDVPPDWAQVKRDYDYVWAYHVPRFSASLAALGERVYAAGELEVYRVRKTSAATPQ